VNGRLPAALHHVLERPVPALLQRTYASWRDDRTIRLGAGLAYYGLFSLSSMLAIVLGFVRVVGRSEAVEEAIVERMEQLLGPEAQTAVTDFIANVEQSNGTRLGLIGLGSLLITGSLFFLALEDAFNQIWDRPVRVGLRSTLRRRAMSLLVLLAAAATLVVTLAVNAVTNLFEALLPGVTDGAPLITSIVTSGMAWAVLGLALALLFKYMPPEDVRWRHALIAAAITGVLVVIGSAVIGWYLRTAGAASVVGVVSTPIAVLLWIYYEAQIVLAGAQLLRTLPEWSAAGHSAPTGTSK
jgi:membrane protein